MTHVKRVLVYESEKNVIEKYDLFSLNERTFELCETAHSGLENLYWLNLYATNLELFIEAIKLGKILAKQNS